MSYHDEADYALASLEGQDIILHPDSHLDHQIPAEVVEDVLSRIQYHEGDGVLIKTLKVEKPVPCALYGPRMGDAPYAEDEVYYSNRGSREYPSRMIKEPMRDCPVVTLIAGPHDGQIVVYTMFGGPLAPKEPTDPTTRLDEMEESKAFWAEHALADGEG